MSLYTDSSDLFGSRQRKITNLASQAKLQTQMPVATPVSQNTGVAFLPKLSSNTGIGGNLPTNSTSSGTSSTSSGGVSGSGNSSQATDPNGNPVASNKKWYMIGGAVIAVIIVAIVIYKMKK